MNMTVRRLSATVNSIKSRKIKKRRAPLGTESEFSPLNIQSALFKYHDIIGSFSVLSCHLAQAILSCVQ